MELASDERVDPLDYRLLVIPSSIHSGRFLTAVMNRREVSFDVNAYPPHQEG